MIEIAITIFELNRIAEAIEKLALIQSAARFTYTLTFGENLMAVYKSDRPDFDFMVAIAATDSEGNVIADAPVPAGHTLSVMSDNPAAFSVTQDPLNPKLVHAHVGGPNSDGTPSQSNVTANLTDPANNLVATGAAQVTVTVGDPALITAITLNLPE